MNPGNKLFAFRPPHCIYCYIESMLLSIFIFNIEIYNKIQLFSQKIHGKKALLFPKLFFYMILHASFQIQYI